MVTADAGSGDSIGGGGGGSGVEVNRDARYPLPMLKISGGTR